MVIRNETAGDRDAVRALNEAAFESRAEALLVDALRDRATPLVSLVAEKEGLVIGHILFSPVTLSDHEDLRIMGLAPMAVAPSHQRRGIGSSLVRVGLDRCKALGAGAVVVLGHPEFYPRFGFVPSTRFGITSEYEVPEDVFMITDLEPGYLRGAAGTIRYHPAFKDV
jgi:putative acetyltransferase